ncbi:MULTISPECIES: DUF3139 domain-containing protein [Brevibacillus]|uniref:DUF3139 domain-containing protein n=1 Tax=Brevibacillus TaxID=55080 RepID=UPI001E32960A|nr:MULTISPECIES: DUF3139 domain-containing protein [Brevibacillus]MDR4999713.1 DUF3139 domain-containing protein [Brevibacillus parabrevis]UED69709.1 DUF3139 domain-containing protein [Brevibacillus sp. HD3.3A]
MRKTLVICMLIFLTVAVSYNFEWIIGGYPQTKSDIQSNVREYLLSEKNYNIADIASIDVTYSRKFGDYSAQVIFSDERETKYYYRIDEKVKQSGYSGKTDKHRES